ncbi:glycosyltransferase family 2 protein [Rhodopirellula bahusiensis]|uniref:glycosyltransferase family 2 protein n=1 Tax=Rhodopirellula bahusiensis TaxID=2014065 RepID=UPI0032994296
MAELVSVIIPAFNSERWIGDCIASVTEQTHENLEIVCVDDGSQDATFEVAHAIAENEKRLTVIQSTNQGACRARNIGIEKSNGKYLQFLDADDLLGKNKIKSQMSLLNGTQLDVATCPYSVFDDSTTAPAPPPVVKTPMDEQTDPFEWMLAKLESGRMNQTACWLIPQQIAMAAGPWNETLRVNQDGEYFCRSILKSRRVAFARNARVYYRRANPTSISRSMNREKAESQIESYKLCSKTLIDACDSSRTRSACTKMFLSFLSQHYPEYPDLLRHARTEARKLSASGKWFVGGSNFSLLCKLTGFAQALILRDGARKLRRKWR